MVMRLPTIISVSKLQNWNLLIKESSSKEQWLQVFSHYHEMRRAGVVDPTLFPPILKACTNLKSLKQGTSVHGCVIKQGFESFTSIGNSTMDFYVKCGFLSSALGVFVSMENKDSVSWNVIIHGYFNQGSTSKEEGLLLFMQARVAGFEPNISTLVLVLQAYRDLKATTHQALGFHGFIIRSGFIHVISVQNSLLCLYTTESGDMESAQKLFDEMLETDVISWSVMIGGHVQSGEGLIAVRLFQEMFSVNGIEPDERTVVSVLKACASIQDIDLGRLIHGYVIRRGFMNCDIFVGNSLIDIYSKCLYATSAIKVFNEMPRRNIVSWNSIISGFVYNEWYSEALRLYSSMEKAGIDADEVTLVTLLQSCKNLVDPARCKSIHSRVIRRGFDSNELVENSLIDAYAKCNLVELAWKLFERMERRDMISWSTMITAFSHSGNTDEALALFQEMMCVQGKFNGVTMLSLFEACAVSAELRRCKWAHGLAIRSGLSTEVAVATALLDMYSKCGEIEISRRVFDHMHERNIVSWSAMIAAYGMNGGVREALALLTEMESQGLKPNGVTLLSVLSACSHGGFVVEGKSLFEKLTNDHEFKPGLEHYSCMVDMLGRAGTVDSAMDLIMKMPEGIMGSGEGASLWGALLSACKNYGNSEVGKTVASHVLKLEPMNSSGYLLASSIYASNGLWDEAAKMRRLVKEKGVKVVSGYSLVHVGNKAYRFVAGDGSHQKSQEIHSVVKQLHSCMKKEERNGLFIGT